MNHLRLAGFRICFSALQIAHVFHWEGRGRRFHIWAESMVLLPSGPLLTCLLVHKGAVGLPVV